VDFSAMIYSTAPNPPPKKQKLNNEHIRDSTFDTPNDSIGVG
jgi:hypothetical protein